MKKKWIFSILSLILVLSMVLTGCGTKSSAQKNTKEKYKTIKIGFPSSGADWAEGALAVAQEYGYLDEYLHALGYDAELTPFTGAAPAIHEAFVSKDLDYAYYAGFAGIAAKSNGIDTKLIAVTSFGSIWQLAVSTDSKIESLQDLKGKKIAYTRGATPQMYILKILEEAGLSAEDVELLNSTVPEGLSSLSSGAVDAAVISYGQAKELVDAGTVKVVHKGIDADPERFYEPMVLTGRSEFVKEHKEVNEAIIKAMLKAKDKMKEDPEAYYKLSAEKSGRPLKQVLEVAVEDMEEGFPISLEERYIDSLKQIESFEIENEIIKKSIDFNSWIEDSYLKNAVNEYEKDKG